MKQTAWLTRNAMTLGTILVVAVYAAFIHETWGWGSVLTLWKQAGFGAMALALALLVSTYVLRTWRIYDYFPNETRGHFMPLFRVVQIHNLLNVMLPFRSGETSFPLLMKKEFDVRLARGTSALLVMRLFDLHALLAAAGLGLVLEKSEIVMWLLWLSFLLLPVFAFAARHPVFRLAERMAPAKAKSIIHEVQAGLPLDISAFARAWGVTFINWFVKIAVLAWVLVLMAGIDLPAGFGGALGGELSSVLPIHAPGGVGTYPAGITAGAVGFGAAADQAALSSLGQAAVNVHLLVIVSSLIGTAMALFVPVRK
ncbi:lysylphosphatidylglycerol synthase domain-containing protein [Agrobacterium sp. fls2-241-TYG-188a]|uniref:lysylphosphatidylglycerol synthase domain-containing protein n=1 Tax=Agrobacterium sp. fls2-241-TYG-188a TaxID=3040275 RepID=UPI002550A55D|nr:lysylphosphatidylglycerol synthase domain-containing protein [Agrobacterium sp. fls2-241-TYG-188a]